MSPWTDDDPQLTRYRRPAASVFDLLGRGEVDLTAAIGWTLAASPALMTALLKLLELDGPATSVAVALESADEQGRTDIELTGSTWKVVIEAKQGLDRARRSPTRQVRRPLQRVRGAPGHHVGLLEGPGP